MSTRTDATIVGVDCAVQPKNVGVAFARHVEGGVEILEVQVGPHEPNTSSYICAALDFSRPILFALDAPLGWPDPLRRHLEKHEAGAPLGNADTLSLDQLFSRRTDAVVRARLEKRPLDVGADRIARTARVALQLLEELRVQGAGRMPLAWKPGPVRESCAIEVYPAATLLARGRSLAGYKERTAHAAREALLAALPELLVPDPAVRDRVLAIDHAFDAAICALAAADFLAGSVEPLPADPEEFAIVRREGWIWFRHRVAPPPEP